MKTQKSFTLIEVIIGVSLILIVFSGIFIAFQLGLEVVGQSRNKITATAIANQQIELIRNLPYELVGVRGGHPDGVLEPITIVVLNNIEFTIETRVDFVIDGVDGIVYPQDPCPNDYKKVGIRISWPGRFGGEVALATDIAPKNLIEECAIVGGVLSISVFNAHGAMILFPLIEVKDPVTNKTLKTATPEDGQHYFALSAATYKVVVSKSGYSTLRTYGTDKIAIPEKPHLTVLEGQMTEASFSIDKVSTFSVKTLTPKGIPIPNVSFNLRGDRIIGRDANENPVYKYSQTHISDAQGHIKITNLKWDAYTFSVDPAIGLHLVDTSPSPQPISLLPNTTLPVTLYLDAENCLLVTVKDKETLEPIFAASVTLSNVALVYNETQYTNTEGKTYFIPLEQAIYNLEVLAPGYLATSTIVSVVGDTTKTIQLERVE